MGYKSIPALSTFLLPEIQARVLSWVTAAEARGVHPNQPPQKASPSPRLVLQSQGSTHGCWQKVGCRGCAAGGQEVKLSRRRRHSHGVGVDGVENNLRSSGRRLRHHVWGEERGVIQESF